MHEFARRALCVALDREDCRVIDTVRDDNRALREENESLRQRTLLMGEALRFPPFIELVQRIERCANDRGLEVSFDPNSDLFTGLSRDDFMFFIPVLNSMHYRVCTLNVPEPRNAFVYLTIQIGPRSELFHRAVTEYMPYNPLYLVPVPF